MKTSKLIALVVLLVATFALQSVCAQDHPTKAEHPTKTEHPAKSEHPTKAEHPAKANDILAVAAGAGNFTTLVAAVEAAGVAEKLQGKGPFTVFAPTDSAFAKLPEGRLEYLLKPANRAQLAGILACHVVPGKIMAADVKTMKATNISGQDLRIEVHDGVVTVEGAKVVQADVIADNGVIHAIDTVIMPAAGEKNPAAEKPKDHPGH